MRINKIILAKPRGFCAGVERAIDVVEECLEIFGKPVYVKHEIVHNKHVVDRLTQKGKEGKNMKRAFNFSAGPAILPVYALEEAQKEIVNFKNSGMSLMEVSHRTPLYEDVHNETISLIRELYKVPDNFDILFLQGGASSQFFMIPMNLVHNDEIADYIITGAWSEKAIKEAKILGKKTNVVATSKDKFQLYSI